MSGAAAQNAAWRLMYIRGVWCEKCEVGGVDVSENELRVRSRAFALQIIQLVEALPRTRAADVIGRQLLRSATSVGANYRAACRAKSLPDFIAKMGIVEEEADECLYWLDLLGGSHTLASERLSGLVAEADALVAMTVASINTAKRPPQIDPIPHSAFRIPHSALEEKCPTPPTTTPSPPISSPRPRSRRGFVAPRYDGWGIANVAPTILRAFGGRG